MNKPLHFPGGKAFAFSIFDDTDRSTLTNVREIYSFLADCGFRTTKSVWPIEGTRPPRIPGETCDNPKYLEWVLKLQESGFEIGYHMATYHSSFRQEAIKGLERFRRLFGQYPKIMANHDINLDNVYWGHYRLTGMYSSIYRLLTMGQKHLKFSGHLRGTPYFWGDICKSRIKYVRNFTFDRINTYAICPYMPYHDPLRPYVNYWFSSSDGSTLDMFNRLLSEKNQDRLEQEGRVCIVTTHFGKGFWSNRGLDKKFRHLMERLSRKSGWFVPVSDLLDFLLKKNGHHVISDGERSRLERRWLLSKIAAQFRQRCDKRRRAR